MRGVKLRKQNKLLLSLKMVLIDFILTATVEKERTHV